jgi:hypothetical protein
MSIALMGVEKLLVPPKPIGEGGQFPHRSNDLTVAAERREF